jgi:hypothetical protein
MACQLDRNIKRKIVFAQRLFALSEEDIPAEYGEAFNRYRMESLAIESDDEESVKDIFAVCGLAEILKEISNRFRGSRNQNIILEKSRFDEINVFHRVEVKNLSVCECGRDMILNKQDSLYTCSCGNSVPIEGANEQKSDSLGSNSAKQTQRHTPSSYFRDTFNRITGTFDSSVEFPEAIITVIRAYLDRTNINITNSAHYAFHLREIMRTLKYSYPELSITKFDKFTSYIFGRLYPRYVLPTLTQEQYDNLLKHFTLIVELYAKHNPKRYIRSYPYIIYKLIEILYPNERELLKFIYIQSAKTYTHNDDLFEEFFKAALPEHKFVKTGIHIYSKCNVRRRT